MLTLQGIFQFYYYHTLQSTTHSIQPYVVSSYIVMYEESEGKYVRSTYMRVFCTVISRKIRNMGF